MAAGLASICGMTAMIDVERLPDRRPLRQVEFDLDRQLRFALVAASTMPAVSSAAPGPFFATTGGATRGAAPARPARPNLGGRQPARRAAVHSRSTSHGLHRTYDHQIRRRSQLQRRTDDGGS